MVAVQDSLDQVLVQLGDVGKYQILVFGLISLAIIAQSAIHVAFVFTAKNVDYRCKIPECDSQSNVDFEPSWLNYAIPYEDGKPKKCDMFAPINSTDADSCQYDSFDRNIREVCDDFVYKTTENTIVHEFDIHCNDKLWMLTLIGTINTSGQFFSMVITGLVSDRFGRKFALMWGMVVAAIFGAARAFSANYSTFALFEFLDALFNAGTYATGFVLAVELVGPKKRILAGTIISCCCAMGEVVAAGVAWLTYDWKLIIFILYIPIFLMLSYQWLVPESVRWLLSQKRYKEAQEILLRAARINGKTISQHALDKLMVTPTEEPTQPLTDVFKSRILVLRFINACFCWVTCAFLFYGLTLNAVSLAGNSYVDFILTSLVEIPAYIATYFTVDRYGRRWIQAGSFYIVAVSCVAYIFINKEQHALSLCFYLLGKFGASVAFTVCYIISSEIFPTPLRHSLMGVCSTIGRIGSLVSPQMPLLEQLWKHLPLVLFSGMGLIAGCLTLFFPETAHIKLPDTIEEAENIGKQSKEKNTQA